LTIAAGAWSHIPMQGVYSSENGPICGCFANLDPEHFFESGRDGFQSGIAVDDIVAQADRNPALWDFRDRKE
jgi:hypothetical protein